MFGQTNQNMHFRSSNLGGISGMPRAIAANQNNKRREGGISTVADSLQTQPRGRQGFEKPTTQRAAAQKSVDTRNSIIQQDIQAVSVARLEDAPTVPFIDVGSAANEPRIEMTKSETTTANTTTTTATAVPPTLSARSGRDGIAESLVTEPSEPTSTSSVIKLSEDLVRVHASRLEARLMD